MWGGKPVRRDPKSQRPSSIEPEIYNALSPKQKAEQVALAKQQKRELDVLILKLKDRLIAIRGMIAFETFSGKNSNANSNLSDDGQALLCSSYVGSSEPVGDERSKLPQQPSKSSESSAAVTRRAKEEEPPAADEVIRQKFLTCISNQQDHLRRQRPKDVEFVPKPCKESQSDRMFENIEKFPSKTDRQLSYFSQTQSEQTANFLRFPQERSESLGSQNRQGFGLNVSGDQGTRALVGSSTVSWGGPGIPKEPASSSCPSSSSFVSVPGPKHSAVVELCCGPSSLLGQESQAKGLKVLRATRTSHNLTTDAGRRKLDQDVGELLKHECVHLWASLPCKPWSRLNEMNGKKLGKKFREYLEGIRDESIELLKVFIKTAKKVIAAGGTVSFEWPAYCLGWQIPGLEDFFKQYGWL